MGLLRAAVVWCVEHGGDTVSGDPASRGTAPVLTPLPISTEFEGDAYNHAFGRIVEKFQGVDWTSLCGHHDLYGNDIEQPLSKVGLRAAGVWSGCCAFGGGCVRCARTCGDGVMWCVHKSSEYCEYLKASAGSSANSLSNVTRSSGAALSDVVVWSGKRLIWTSCAILIAGAMGLFGYVVWKWHFGIDGVCSRRVTHHCGPSLKAFVTANIGGPCLYCRKAHTLRFHEGMVQMNVPMMRCWSCMHRPAFANIWVHESAYDRAFSVIHRHIVKGDWTADSEVRATHGQILADLHAMGVSVRVLHSEVILIIAALNSCAPMYIEDVVHVDLEGDNPNLIEPLGRARYVPAFDGRGPTPSSDSESDSGDSGDDDDDVPPPLVDDSDSESEPTASTDYTSVDDDSDLPGHPRYRAVVQGRPSGATANGWPHVASTAPRRQRSHGVVQGVVVPDSPDVAASAQEAAVEPVPPAVPVAPTTRFIHLPPQPPDREALLAQILESVNSGFALAPPPGILSSSELADLRRRVTPPPGLEGQHGAGGSPSGYRAPPGVSPRAEDDPPAPRREQQEQPGAPPVPAQQQSVALPEEGSPSVPAGSDMMYLPFGTLGQGYPNVDVVREVPPTIALTPAHHPGAGREPQLAKREHELHQYSAVKETSSMIGASGLLAERESHPQYMVIGSCVTEKELPHVAGSGRAVERAAILNRHFAECTNIYGGKTGVCQTNAATGISAVVDHVINALKLAGRCAAVYQEFPEGYDANAHDAAAAVQKRTTLLRDVEFMAYIPGSWSKERGRTGFSKMPNTEAELKLKHTFFVKMNEALQKVKPRLIQAIGDQGCTVHTFDAGFFDAICFGMALFEKRSVKHAGPEHLRARLARRIYPFMTGGAGSFDYSKFDSSNCQHKHDPLHALKEHIENRILKELFGQDATSSTVTRAALEDRCRKFLRSRSAFWILYAKTFGRESGDRGTSCLNFLVNIVLFLAIMACEEAYRDNCKKHPDARNPVGMTEAEAKKFSEEATANVRSPWINAYVQSMQTDIESIKKWLRGEPTGYDIFGEGDDGLWLFTKKYLHDSPGGVSAMCDRIMYWSSMQGMNLEPQDELGEAFGARRIQPANRRMEHCSRIIVPYNCVGKQRNGKKLDSLRVGLLPKMRKTIEAADITFGLDAGVKLTDLRKDTIAFTKFASCAFNCVDDPLMFEYFFAHARVKLQGEGSATLDPRCKSKVQFEYSSKNYVHRNMAKEFGGKTSTLNEEEATNLPCSSVKLLQMLRQRHELATSYDGHTDAMRRAVMLESPDITEEFYTNAVSGLKATGTWQGCAEWSRLIKARLGAV